jgi:outer membrane lipoprotein-sorting protein
MGMEMPMSMCMKRPNKMRNEFEFQGTKMIQTYNGTEGYMINPMTGSTEAMKVGDSELAQFKDQSDLDGKFFNYKEKGNTLELMGTETINGANTYKIKLVEKPVTDGQTGKTTFHFFDCLNFTVVKSISTENMQGVDTEMEIYFTYKQIDGVSVPSSIEAMAGGNSVYKMTFDDIKINEELSDDLFEKPSN